MTKRQLFSKLWLWHSAFALLALLGCVPILWPQVFLPDAWEARIISYSGVLVLGAGLASLLLLLGSSFLLLLRLNNLRTLGQLLVWGGIWSLAGLIFGIFAWVANVPRPGAETTTADPIQRTDTLYNPEDHLTGPRSLVIPISLDSAPRSTISPAPHLLLLEKEHPELLHRYITSSPRWAIYTTDDTFYAKPGHVVMVPPTSGGIPGLVHVAFRRLVEGEPLPADYTRVKPGDPMPAAREGSEQVADLAVDLGQDYYLLLAWRGTSHTDTAHRALNAALSAVDSLVQPLAESPDPATLDSLLNGQSSTAGSTPELRLCQPPAQYGTYQAEIYANPQEAGSLVLRIEDLETHTTLRIFTSQARFSDNADELFRHDIPGALSDFIRSQSHVGLPGLLPTQAPFFVVRLGESHQFFGVALEVTFSPASKLKPSRVLLRRNYRVQAYETHGTPPHPAPTTTPEVKTPPAAPAAAEAPTPAHPEPTAAQAAEPRPTPTTAPHSTPC